ncbi:hypothetical protein OAN62_01330 [Gammaproteobacteria bacterium]|jgi:antitoxin component YwqK of YwqJK toxin-antitoxin module|nr:hypothetical protein [Gammaproteobacteria bacterium]
MKKNIKKLNKKDGIAWKWEEGIERAYSNKDGRIMHGHYKHYHDGGTINQVGTWINGLKEGAWQTFYENGQLFSRGFYKNDKRFPSDRAWDFFKENGERFPDSIHDEY